MGYMDYLFPGDREGEDNFSSVSVWTALRHLHYLDRKSVV